MRNIGSYFKVVDADEHRIIEELRNLREKKRKDADDIFAADDIYLYGIPSST